MERIIVAGSRRYEDYTAIFDVLNRYTRDKDLSEIEIVSGLASGPDTVGKGWAYANNVPCKEFPAKWDEFGKGAGFIRNAEMAEYGDTLIAFLATTRQVLTDDGVSTIPVKSNGTKNMIRIAKKRGLKVRVFLVEIPWVC